MKGVVGRGGDSTRRREAVMGSHTARGTGARAVDRRKRARGEEGSE